MAANIRLLPSGHEFVSEGNASLLESGLGAGLALAYACSNGNCGECLAKVVSGEVHKTRHHDYRIGDEKKASGHVLMCCNVALTDVVLEAEEARGSHEIPQQQITARVKNIEVVNADVALVHLKTPRSNRLRFLAGQHVTLQAAGFPAASHSVASCPCDDINLHFQVPRMPGDGFSEYVFSAMKKNDRLEISGPQGEFVLNEESPRGLVFIAWHTGFAPIRSLIEQAMALEISQSIQLVWMTANGDDRYFDNLCRSWQDALDEFNYITIDTERGADQTELILQKLDIKPAELSGFDFYIAGTEALLSSCKKYLTSSGLPVNQLKADILIHP